MMKTYMLTLAALSALTFAYAPAHADQKDPGQAPAVVNDPGAQVADPAAQNREPGQVAAPDTRAQPDVEAYSVSSLKMLYYYNQKEIFFARLYLYLERPVDDGLVADYARGVIRDLSAVNSQLEAVAMTRGLRLGDSYAWADAGRSPRSECAFLMPADRRLKNEMTVAAGSDIDFIYVSREINIHAEAYQGLAADASRSELLGRVSAFELPAIERLYRKSKSVNRELCNESRFMCRY